MIGLYGLLVAFVVCVIAALFMLVCSIKDSAFIQEQDEYSDSDTNVKKGNEEDVVFKDDADFVNETTSPNSASEQVTSVEFSGPLSNERNERTTTFDYARDEREWKIEDGMKDNISYTLDELQDTKELMDIGLCKKTYNDLSDVMTEMDDNKVHEWISK